MGIKITFTDTDTNTVISEDEITHEQVKALNTELETSSYTCPVCGKTHTGIVGWILNMLGVKAMQKVNEIVIASGRGTANTDLTTKLQIISDLEAENSDLLMGAIEREQLEEE